MHFLFSVSVGRIGGFQEKERIMLRQAMVGLVVMGCLLVASVGTASANHHHGGHYGGHHSGYQAGYHSGYGHIHHGYAGGYGGNYGYGYGPRAILPPAPVYAYPPVVGYGYGVQPGCGLAHGYARPGFSLNTPGFGLYVR